VTALEARAGRLRPSKGLPLRFDLNAATEFELMSVPEIDFGTARRIVETRDQRLGLFRRVEDLAHIGGVSAAALDRFRRMRAAFRKTGMVPIMKRVQPLPDQHPSVREVRS
jgi:predicted DNA-binding helix-hairpin-helix protein